MGSKDGLHAPVSLNRSRYRNESRRKQTTPAADRRTAAHTNQMPKHMLGWSFYLRAERNVFKRARPHRPRNGLDFHMDRDGDGAVAEFFRLLQGYNKNECV